MGGGGVRAGAQLHPHIYFYSIFQYLSLTDSIIPSLVFSGKLIVSSDSLFRLLSDHNSRRYAMCRS